MRHVVLMGVAAIALVAVGAYVLGRPAEPAALPEGAAPLSLRTMPPEWSFPGLHRGCPLAALLPVRVMREGESISFETADSGELVSLVFPSGFTAWLVAGRAELVSPSGAVIAREGDVVSGLMGGAADSNDFILCFDPATKLHVTPAPTGGRADEKAHRTAR